MARKIIFYGGCKGVGKSERLNKVIMNINKARGWTEKKSPLVRIDISDVFEKFIKQDRGYPDNKKILWSKEDWKQYDDKVTTELCETMNGDCIYIINNHFCVTYMGQENYLPGLELNSLEKLLNDRLKVNNEKDFPLFGLLLIDPAPSLITKYHVEQYDKDKIENESILHYQSEQSINRDLEQNRSWAYSYYDTALAVLGRKKIYRETIYITKNNTELGFFNIEEKISTFLERFIR